MFQTSQEYVLPAFIFICSTAMSSQHGKRTKKAEETKPKISECFSEPSFVHKLSEAFTKKEYFKDGEEYIIKVIFWMFYSFNETYIFFNFFAKDDRLWKIIFFKHVIWTQPGAPPLQGPKKHALEYTI